MQDTNGLALFLGTALLIGAVAIGVVVVATAAVYILLGICILASFMAFTWSIVCAIAWRRPFCLGNIFLHPIDARAFVVRGLFGALVVPAFLFACQMADIWPVNWDYAAFYVLGGYSALSAGLEYLFARKRDLPHVYYDVEKRSPAFQTSRQTLLPPPAPHRFASWDDEEEHGR